MSRKDKIILQKVISEINKKCPKEYFTKSGIIIHSLRH